MEWSMEDVFKIINLYRQFPCLWDIRSSLYKRSVSKRNAWQEIAKTMEKDEEEVKKKMKNLRTAYVAEKKKVESSKKSRSSGEETYYPHLYYYKELDFLSSAVMFRKTTTNFEKVESETPILSFEEENCDLEESCNFNDCLVDEEQNQETLMSSSSVVDTPITSKNYIKSMKRKKNNNRDEKFNSAIDAFVRQADMSCSMMSSSKKEEDNMYMAFGKSISLQLSQLSLASAAEAMSEIQVVVSNKIIKDSLNIKIQNL